MDNGKELKVGDKIYSRVRDRIDFFGEVERVTKTMAFVKKTKFRKPISNNGYVYFVKNDGWGFTSYMVESEDILRKYRLQKAHRSLMRSIEELQYRAENVFEKYGFEKLQNLTTDIENIIKTYNE